MDSGIRLGFCIGLGLIALLWASICFVRIGQLGSKDNPELLISAALMLIVAVIAFK